MSQYAFSGNTIINQSFPDTRTALNAAYAALASNSSGDNDPTSVAGGSLATVQHQWWYDSANNKLMLRNDANNAWIEIATIDETSGNVLSITTQGLTIGATALTATGTEINQLSAITRGSILYGNASGVTSRLAKGAAATVLTSDGTDISWAAAGGGGAMELITRTVISDGDTTVNFTGFDADTYDHYRFYFSNVVLDTDLRNLVGVTSSDGGSNYDTGASDYAQTALMQSGTTSATPTFTTDNDDGFAFFRLAEGLGSVTTNEKAQGVCGTLEIFNAGDSSKFTNMHFKTSHVDAAESVSAFFQRDAVARRTEAAIVNAVQFKLNANGFESGIITMYGIKKS
tara:strand:- start:300 stop:1328 length:1029 start_codon:yes stop_codon:yes gene_type:complete